MRESTYTTDTTPRAFSLVKNVTLLKFISGNSTTDTYSGIVTPFQ
jgi:hypothetical protein